MYALQLTQQSAAYGAPALEPVFAEIESAPARKGAVGSARDQVQLSKTFSGMKQKQEEIDAIPEVRIQLVEEINEKIKHNGYPFKSDLYKSIERLLD